MNTQSSTEKTFIQKIKEVLDKIGKYFAELFGRRRKFREEELGISEADTANPPEFIDLMKDSFLVEWLKDHEMVRKLILKVGNLFWRGGWRDGKVGQRKTQIYEIVKNRAYIIQDEIKATYNARVAQLTTEKELNDGIHKHAANDFETHKEYHEVVTDKYRTNPRNFSTALAIIYLTIAVLLVLADIPLALKLTQIGFDLDLGENFAIKDLFMNPWGVFQENWEVFVLAFGIALCTIYIKIFYDEFLEKPLARSVKQFKELKEKEGIDTDEEIKKIKQIYWGRIAFKTAVLILAIVTIFMLGLFRFETIEYENQLRRMTQQETLDPGLDQILGPQSQSGQSTASGQTQVSEDSSRKGITQATFILITLLFPVVGGICASIGLNYWHNRRELKACKRLLEESKAAYLKATEDLKTSEKSLDDQEHIKNWAESEGFVEHIIKLFLNYYNHGYQRGLMEPVIISGDKGLFERAEELRNKLTTRQVYEHLQDSMVDKDINFDEKLEKDFGKTVEKTNRN